MVCAFLLWKSNRTKKWNRMVDCDRVYNQFLVDCGEFLCICVTHCSTSIVSAFRSCRNCCRKKTETNIHLICKQAKSKRYWTESKDRISIRFTVANATCLHIVCFNTTTTAPISAVDMHRCIGILLLNQVKKIYIYSIWTATKYVNKFAIHFKRAEAPTHKHIYAYTYIGTSIRFV